MNSNQEAFVRRMREVRENSPFQMSLAEAAAAVAAERGSFPVRDPSSEPTAQQRADNVNIEDAERVAAAARAYQADQARLGFTVSTAQSVEHVMRLAADTQPPIAAPAVARRAEQVHSAPSGDVVQQLAAEADTRNLTASEAALRAVAEGQPVVAVARAYQRRLAEAGFEISAADALAFVRAEQVRINEERMGA